MKKFLLILALLPTLALAQHYHHYPHQHHRPYWQYSGGTWNWIVPALIGGVIVHEITRQPQPSTVIVEEKCTPWREIQRPDGIIYRERTCTQ